jgi:hypothetical protein
MQTVDVSSQPAAADSMQRIQTEATLRCFQLHAIRVAEILLSALAP